MVRSDSKGLMALPSSERSKAVASSPATGWPSQVSTEKKSDTLAGFSVDRPSAPAGCESLRQRGVSATGVGPQATARRDRLKAPCSRLWRVMSGRVAAAPT